MCSSVLRGVKRRVMASPVRASGDGSAAAVSRSRFCMKRRRCERWCRDDSREVNGTTMS